MQLITVKSDDITLQVSSLGAQMESVKFDGKEMLWQGDEKYWKGKAPVLFPISGGMKDRAYTYKDIPYSMPFHGLARQSEFEVVEVSENSVSLKLSANEYTKEYYPFDFDFIVTYIVDGATVKVIYKVINKGEESMYFSFGSHESFNTFGGFCNHSLVFEKEERFLSSVVSPTSSLLDHTYDDFGKGKTLNLSYDLLIHNTFILAGLNSRAVTLMNKDKKVATMQFDAPNLLVWSMPEAPYVCIEPWHNLPDYEDTDGKIENKPGIIKLESKNTYINEHKITYFKN